MEANPEFVDLFQQLDGMVNAFDAEGSGPLRKGETAFTWAAVEKLALPLAQAVPDLRVGIWLLRAELAQFGLPGLARGLGRLASWLQLPADQLHPRPEAGEHPRALHGLLLAWLTTRSFLALVREASVWHDAPLTVAALLDSADPLADLAGSPANGVVDALADSLASIGVLDTALAAEASAADVSLASLQDALARTLRRLQDALAPAVAEPEPVPGAYPEPITPVLHAALAPLMPSQAPDSIATREAVGAALDKLIQYFVQHEPGHPALILLRRIHRMLGASFEDLLMELFPQANQLVAQLDRPSPV